MANPGPANAIKLLQASGVFPEHQESQINDTYTMVAKNHFVEPQKWEIFLDTLADRLNLNPQFSEAQSLISTWSSHDTTVTEDDVAALSGELIWQMNLALSVLLNLIR